MTSPSKRTLLLLIGITVVAVLAVLYVWHLPPFRGAIQVTEDAYVRGNVTVIASKVDGYVVAVRVQDFMTVNAGDVLVQLDDRNYLQKLEQARGSLAVSEANLANLPQTRRVREASVGSAEAQIASARAQVVNAQAQLDRARSDMRRVDSLVASGSLSQRERDQTNAALRLQEAAVLQTEATAKQATAGREVATQDLHSVVFNGGALEGAVASGRAAVRLAEIDVENTQVRAPTNGRVGEVGVKLGQYVTPGAQLMSVVPSAMWVTANFKEGQTEHMRAGQPAVLTVDALGHAEIRGRVERISPATGSEFSVIKPDNATGNFTKIPQRLMVRIAVDPDQALADQLRPGMSVIARVDTTERLAEAQNGVAR